MGVEVREIVVIYREATRSDVPQILALVHRIYTRRWSAGFFFWLLFENVHQTITRIAIDNATVVGMFGVQIRKISPTMNCAQVIGINVDRQYRRQGVFSHLADSTMASLPSIDLLAVLANQDAVTPCTRKLGMTFVGALTQYLVGPKVSIPEVPFPWHLGGTAPCSEGSWRQQGVFHFEHSPDFCKWRFQNHPMYTYYGICISPTEFGTVKLYTDPLSGTVYGDIVDVQCSLHSGDRLAMVLSASTLALRDLGASIVDTWAVPGSFVATALDKIGFSAGRCVGHFGLRMINSHCPGAYSFDKWHLVPSDSTNY